MPVKPPVIHFSVPKPFHHGDGRAEPGAPYSIEHRHDYLWSEGRRDFEYSYNQFIYRWKGYGRDFEARMDAHETSRISIMLPFEEFSGARFKAVLAWLQRRFLVIDTFETENGAGYVTRWQLDPMRAGRN